MCIYFSWRWWIRRFYSLFSVGFLFYKYGFCLPINDNSFYFDMELMDSIWLFADLEFGFTFTAEDDEEKKPDDCSFVPPDGFIFLSLLVLDQFFLAFYNALLLFILYSE